MKNIKRINEFFCESLRDDIKNKISSSIETSGHLDNHAQDIKDDILNYVDQLLDDEIESINQLSKLQNGEISEDDVDITKLMDFGQKLNDHLIGIVNKYNDLYEGKTFQDVKKMHPKKAWDPNKKEDFRKQIKNLVKSQEHETKQVGNDLEVICDGEVVAQVMFRDNYVGVKKVGNKFTDEFDYTELGKIKKKVSEIMKSCKK